MSRKSQAKHSIFVANSKIGGARITKTQSKLIGDRFVEWCFKNNYFFNSITDATQEMLAAYMQYLKMQGISVATKHNRLSSIRRAMKSLNCDPNAKGITAKAVGLAPRSRVGTKMPIPDNIFEEVIRKACELNESGFVIALRLQRLLGLRGLESLMVVSSLEKFALDANQVVNGVVPITDGTKGGRSRITNIIRSKAAETLQTILDALLFMREHNGFLIEGGKLGLKSAVSKYHRLAKQVGLVGQHAPHSLRYAYCIDKLIELRDAGYNRKEATSFVANYLGHGDSRGRYVSMVYGKTVVHTLPVEKRKTRLNRAIENIEQVVSEFDLNR
jgi:site-specific recombinase XerD